MFGKLKKIISAFTAAVIAATVIPITASATTMASGSISCSDKSLKPGEESEIKISLKGIPYTGKVVPNDVVLLIDTSSSMGNSAVDAMKDAATTFVKNVDTNTHHIGIVDYNSNAEIKGTGLSGNKTVIKNNIADIRSSSGSTAMDAGINKAVEVLAKKRSATTGAIVLMTDGAPDNQDAAIKAATEAKSKGYVFYTVALTDSANSSANTFLKKLATSEADHYYVFSTDKLDGVYTSIGKKIGACTAQNVTLQATISSHFNYVKGSGDSSIPQPQISGRTLTWKFPQLSSGVSTVSFKVTPNPASNPGTYTAVSAYASYLDNNNQGQRFTLSVPNVTIENMALVKNLKAEGKN
ncbi:MAG: VWA domain-containing protein, partial [Oscillospiraceae bacterium]